MALPRVEERLRVQRLVLHDPESECVGTGERLPRVSVRQSMRGAVHPEGGRSSLTESRQACAIAEAAGGSLARQMGMGWTEWNECLQNLIRRDVRELKTQPLEIQRALLPTHRQRVQVR